MKLKPTDHARFWRRVDSTGICWEWTGYRNPDGYGAISLGGRSDLRTEHGPGVQASFCDVLPELLREPVQARSNPVGIPACGGDRASAVRHAHVCHPPSDHPWQVVEFADTLKLLGREEHTIHRAAA